MPEQLSERLPAPLSQPTLGDRVRQLRIARGLTQSALAGERFSKEYVSQIERDKTRPTAQTIEWLAKRLGVDASFLEIGVSAGEAERIEAVISSSEAALESNRHQEAIDGLGALNGSLGAGFAPELEFRRLVAEAWGRMYVGDVRAAVGLVEQARALAEGPRFTDVDRADALYRLGCCRLKLSSTATAIALFTHALELASRSGLPADRLMAHIFEWRSRCYRRQRDWEAAREDVERALELAEGLNDRQTIAHTYFQASILAERTGQWVLARSYAERAKAQYEEIADRVNVGKLLNNLGGLDFLLGKPNEAIDHLKEAFRVALEVDSKTDAAYAISSLAQVHQRTGRHELAEDEARRALELLDGREDLIDEIGNAQLVLGRALLEQARLAEADEALALAETSFGRLASASHTAAVWVAQGDLATRRGDDRTAARLYRRAAEALQDFSF
jgi:tetratricopeptide (TPR) repeat protein